MPEQKESTGAVIALAGRRVDAEGTDLPQFPAGNVTRVRKRLADLLLKERAVALVCSAACGADLVALEEAERLGIRRRVVLPFSPECFRATSVVDRPGGWGPLFDRVVETARATGDLVELDANASDGDTAYAAANEVIVREARSIAAAGRLRLLAVLVWDGAARKRGDATDDFRRLAAASHFDEQTVLTV
jgi:hypothetical protein